MARVEYVAGLKAGAKDVVADTADGVARTVLVNYGHSEYFEWLRADRIGKPYFDVDGNAAVTHPDALLEAACRGLDTFFGGAAFARLVHQV